MIKKVIPHIAISTTLNDINGYKGSFFSNLIYRIKNLFKAIIGKSDWDIAHKKLTEYLVEPGISDDDLSRIKMIVTNIMHEYVNGMGQLSKVTARFYYKSKFAVYKWDSIEFTH